METLKNLQKVSLVFFIIIGSIHLFSQLLIVNNLWLKSATIITRTFDIPFALSGLLYGLSSLRLNLNNYYSNTKLIDGILVGIGVLAMGILIYVNFIVPDR